MSSPKFVDDEIVSIEYAGVHHTYDITVEEDHSFVANSFVVHNTVMKNPTIQTVPQRGEFAKYAKRCFVADKGWLMGARDLGQSEIRIIGWLAQDRNILQALKDNIDIHVKTASVVNETIIEKVTKQMRQDAKGVNFGLIYGMGARNLRIYVRENYVLILTEEECEQVRDAFFARPNGYYALPRFHRRQEGLAKKQGYVRSPLGRIRRLPDAKSKDWKLSGNACRQAINFPVQSFSSDLGLIGMYLFWLAIKKNEKGLRDKVNVMWFIHDSTIFQAKRSAMPRAMALLKDCMEHRAKVYVKQKFGVNIGYPITSDGKLGTSWDNLKDVE